jgi:hypothetical protein
MARVVGISSAFSDIFCGFRARMVDCRINQFDGKFASISAYN